MKPSLIAGLIAGNLPAGCGKTPASQPNLEPTAENSQMRAECQRMDELFGSLPNPVVKMGDVSLKNGLLEAEITVFNHNGHKRPTGFPSRRAWLHVQVSDGSGQMVFESGTFDQQGRIIGNHNDADPSSYEPHYDLIDSPDQVHIYEAIYSRYGKPGHHHPAAGGRVSQRQPTAAPRGCAGKY